MSASGAPAPRVLVVDARESAALDAETIEAGVPSRALMQRAGAAAAAELTLRFPKRLARGVAIFAGPGNNGGDAWVVARALAAAGVRVRVAQIGQPKTPDAIAERELALAGVELGEPEGGEGIVVDGLLGTGSSGAPRGDIAGAIAMIAACRARGALVAALDVPSGVDASSGAAEGAAAADITFTFGTMKRGLLVARGIAGRIVVLDIGLASGEESLPRLLDAPWVFQHLPPIPAEAHKGTRRKLAIIGGGPGMAGAAILAARAALRSGIGMVRLVVAPANLPVVQSAAYDSLAAVWPTTDDAVDSAIRDWADVLLIGPGLGRTPETRALVERVLERCEAPVVLDADALNVFEGAASRLAGLLGGRPALVTPHAAEFSRLSGRAAREVLDERFDIGPDLARTLLATVLLKGVPTIVTSPSGERLVAAAGTPALATAGSGDVLAGIAATLLAQTGDALVAGACAAWVHGRAAELAGRERALRGVSLEDVVDALRIAWTPDAAPPRAPVLAELPAVGEGA